MNKMHGAFFLPVSKRSRTRLAPTPTNISTKSEPDMLKNGTPASPATARARSVLPVPGGPTSNAPFGIRPPSSSYFLGAFRNSTSSCRSCFASSQPATSLKVVFFFGSVLRIFAWLLPKLNGFLPGPPIWRLVMIQKNAMRRMTGRNAMMVSIHVVDSWMTFTFTPLNISHAVICSFEISSMWLENLRVSPSFSERVNLTMGLLFLFASAISSGLSL